MHRLLLATLSLLLLGTEAHADELSRRASCRLSFGNSVRQRSIFLVNKVWLCHHARLRAKISPSIDCSDTASWTGSGYTDGADALAQGLERFRAQSAACTVPTTVEVGYTSCPAPCGALPTTTFPELGECLECVIQAAAYDTLQTTLGLPGPSVSRAAHGCQQNIARGTLIYLNKRMKMQHDCQVLKEIGEPGFVGVDCAELDAPAHPYYERGQRAVAKITQQITRRCATTDLGTELDTCGTDTASQIACVRSATDHWMSTLMSALYPPF